LNGDLYVTDIPYGRILKIDAYLDLIVLTGVGPRLCNNHQLQPIFEKFISPRVRSFSILDPSTRPPIVHPLAAPQPYLAMQPTVRFWPVPMVSTKLQLCDARR
jgi:hypothetical protein